MTIIRVALDIPIDSLFDYIAPDATQLDIGSYARVPFGKKFMIGIILAISDEAHVSHDKLKQADEILRNIPPIPPALIELFEFCSYYYHYPIGRVIMNGIPTRLRSIKPVPQRFVTSFLFRLTETGYAIALSSIPGRSKTKHHLLTHLKEVGTITSKEAKQFSQRAPKLLQEFLAQGWVEKILEGPEFTPNINASPILQLTTEQITAIDTIQAEIGLFNTWLLHGITGSGKTEVYLQITSTLLKQKCQVLILVPEINLTPRLEEIFRSRFPTTHLISLHSKLNPTERMNGWLQAQRGEASIVLGTRLAIFTPLPKLGLIIVDEEHDPSFKQQDGLRYSARDIAIFRAKQANVPILLGSATPSLESYYNAITGRYRRILLRARAVKNATLPIIHYVNTRSIQLKEGLSEPLLIALERTLTQKQQSMVFINRRGYAPVLLCKSCTWLATCSRCSSRLVVHLTQKNLRCHYCGYTEQLPPACPQCGDQDLMPFGHGTQRIEAALAKLFPHARILRVDRDNTRGKEAWQLILNAIHKQQVDILVGTQLLAKGHDFPNLSLVGVLSADTSLYSMDFRAEERLFAQLMQVAGRAGRAETAGEVLIQTEFPNHPLYVALQQHDYDAYAQILLREREITHFPPYSHQALLNAEAPHIASAIEFLSMASKLVEPGKQIEIFDPVPAQMTRLKGLERAHLLVQSHSRKKLQLFLSEWYMKLCKIPRRKVRWALDVDPSEF
ncbi:primosomal protein N' [Nitrosomonas sp. Nm34]|uniref:primosomal protein N' n=1 Tax=Nitrosomonas sp. Nm34 TaxID=1881055 RepID=UPI0008E8E835|nr:primosomal protein N' [Nitrosomonas sp. Nm34]SFI48098.1 replication restart DNA helicase PriA [Nitrosomonas sp. Nm34]